MNIIIQTIIACSIVVLTSSCNFKSEDINYRRLSSKISELPFLSVDTITVVDRSIRIAYSDSVSHFDPFLEREIQLYILNEIDDRTTVHFEVFYPLIVKRTRYTASHADRNSVLRKFQNPIFTQMTTKVIEDPSSRDGLSYMLLLNLEYGLLMHNSLGKEDAFFYENSFDLLYGYAKECHDGISGKYHSNMASIIDNLETKRIEALKNDNWVVNIEGAKTKINALLEICDGQTLRSSEQE